MPENRTEGNSGRQNRRNDDRRKSKRVVVVGITKPSWAWFVVTFGTIVLINGTLHVLGSGGSASYSPGVITGLALYLPLGITTLRLGRTRSSAGTFWAAVLLGVAIHGVVAVVAFWG